MTRPRIALLYLGTLAALLFISWLVLRQSDVTRGMIERQLGEVLAAERFELGGAGFDFAVGEAQLREFRLSTPPANPGRFALSADRIDVGIGTHPMRAPGALRHLHAHGVRIELDLVDGRLPSFDGLFLPPPETENPARPELQLHDVEIAVRWAADRAPLTTRIPRATLRPDADSAQRYGIELDLEPAGLPELELAGMFDTESGALELRARSKDAGQVDLDRVAAASPELASLLADFAVGAELLTFQASAERAPESSDNAAVWAIEADAELGDVSLGGPRVALPIDGASGRVQFAWRSDAAPTLTFSAVHADDDGRMEGAGKVTLNPGAAPHFEASITGTDLRVRPGIGSALAGVPAARSAWDAFNPRGGRFDFELHLASPTAEAGGVFDLSLEVRGAGGRYVGFIDKRRGTRAWGFPVPLEDVHGNLRIRNGQIWIDEANAKLGEGRVNVSGTLDVRGKVPPTIDLLVRAPRVPFSKEIHDALATLHAPSAAIWDEYSPSGESAVEVRVATGPDRPDAGVHVHLRPLLAAATYEGFPCRVRELEGRVDIGPNGVEIDLRGRRDEAGVALRGRFATASAAAAPGDTAAPSAELAIRTDGLELDRELTSALGGLSADVPELIDLFGLQCRADAEVLLWRDADRDPFRMELRVDVRDGRAELETMGIPAINLQGELFVHGDGSSIDVDIDGLRGEVAQRAPTPPAQLFLQGRAAQREDGREVEIAVLVDGLDLDERVAQAVDRYGVFPVSEWRVLKPSGLVDLAWQSKRTQPAGADNADVKQTFDIRLRDVGVGAEFLPGPAEHLTGAVTVEDGTVTLRDLRGRMLGAEFRCPSGSLIHEDGATRLEADVESSDFPIDDNFANLLQGPLRQTYLDRDLSGRVQIDDLNVVVTVPDSGASWQTRLRGAIQARDLAMAVGGRIDEFSGPLTIERADFGPDVGLVDGRIAGARLRLLGQRIAHLDTRFSIDAQSALLSDLEARVHRGAVRGMSSEGTDVYYSFADGGDLRCDLSWENASLQELLPGSGLRGNLGVRLELSGLPNGDLGKARGEGFLSITGGDLGDDPIFRAIYAWLEKPRRPVYRDLRAEFRLENRQLRIPSLEVISDQARIQGKGHVGLDGYVDLELSLPDLFGKNNDWMLLPWVVRKLSDQLLQPHLRGYLNNLEFDVYGPGDGPGNRGPLRPLPSLGRESGGQPGPGR